MPSQIHEEGRVPMTKHPTHPRTHIEVSNSPQMAIPLIQMQSSDERSTPMSKGSRRRRSDGERRWHRGDAIYENHSFTSDEHTRQAEDPSGLDKEQGTGDMHAIRQAKHLRRHRGGKQEPPNRHGLVPGAAIHQTGCPREQGDETMPWRRRTWRPAEDERQTWGTTDECIRKSRCRVEGGKKRRMHVVWR
jgi:hypothetical protein